MTAPELAWALLWSPLGLFAALGFALLALTAAAERWRP